ncbi:uncharacterized protein FIBRA_06782 [Fibroporia radiculosa]|uniref:Uncharacterized protein n=1 Tax=Fibroporia radiculosa TaxID=599839 RepID=J4GTH5_9APHY|nr:uncharacterized protein FIBRA_06782 [Fibroporia radiculosa]CCM04600.1 predicted protein [Fibroporia radiculosa]
MPPKGNATPSNSRQVNNLLHTLRGEDFRHAQNLLQSNKRTTAYTSHTSPTLPFDQIYLDEVIQPRPTQPRGTTRPVLLGPQGFLEYAYPRGLVPGPPPPKSWRDSTGREKDEDIDEPARRAQMFSLIFSYITRRDPQAGIEGRETTFPSLALLCLQVLLSVFPDSDDGGFAEEVAQYLPPHLRRDMLRWSAVHSPLPTSKLYALCEPDGHAEGELIVVGPQASLSRDLLRKNSSATSGSVRHTSAESTREEWDSPVSDAHLPAPLHTIVLLTVPLPLNTLLAFPPTLTHLALLSLPTPAPIHRLPRICPLLEVLDLSYNPWLSMDTGLRGFKMGAEVTLNRVEWDRWSRLKVLGLVGCVVDAELVVQINKGRWEDIAIIGVESINTG